MNKQQELALVKNIIEDGYDNLEAISFELNIPLSTLKDIKKQINFENKALLNSTNKQVRFAGLRKKYYAIFNKTTSSTPTKQTIALNYNENEKLAQTLESLNSILTNSKLDKKEKNKKILDIFALLDNYEGSVEQLDKLLTILLEKTISPDRKVYIKLLTYKKAVATKLSEALKNRIEALTDRPELLNMKHIIRNSLSKVDYTTASILSEQIDKKISTQQEQNIALHTSNKLSANIKDILKAITSSEINEVLVNDALNNEIRCIKTNTSAFALSEEQKKRQIYFTITRALKNNASEYPIENPVKTMEALQKIFNMSFSTNLRAIVYNYIERKDFKSAQSLCDEYLNNLGYTSKDSDEIKRTKEDIHKAEIGAIIQKALAVNSNETDLNNFFNILDKKLSAHRYSPGSIPLGKTKDGSKKITLADLYEEKGNFER